MALFDKVKQQLGSRLDQAKLNKEIEQLRQVLPIFQNFHYAPYRLRQQFFQNRYEE